MDIEEFNKLDDQQQRELLFEAKKINEKEDHEAKRELFEVEDFYIEVKTNLPERIKRVITTYSKTDIPPLYSDGL